MTMGDEETIVKGWYCSECKKNVDIIIDTYDIHDGAGTPPDKIGELVRDLVEWDVICAECEGPVEWRGD